MVGLVVAAVAFSSCGITTSQTAIEAGDTETAPATATEAVPAATTAPVVVPATATEADSETTAVETDDSATEPTRGERAGAPADDEPVEVPETIVEAPSTDAASEDAPTTEPEEDDTEESETATFNQVDVAGCMDGVWASQPGQVGAYTAHLAELTGAPMSAAGRITIALENGRYVYDASVTTSIDVDGFQTLSVVEGITQGDFTYTNGFIVAEQTFADIDAFVELPDGTRIDAGVLGEEFNQMAAFHEVPFDCTGGDTITMHFDTLPGHTRFPMTFERQP